MVIETTRDQVNGYARPEGEIVLEAHGVTVGFGDNIVLENLSLDIRRGEILGFVGASGSPAHRSRPDQEARRHDQALRAGCR